MTESQNNARLTYDSSGFSTDEFGPEERSMIRARHHYIDEEFTEIRDLLAVVRRLKPLQGLAAIVAAARPLILTFGGLSVIGAAIAWAVDRGFFG